MWLATTNGLSRFDGTNFTVYRHDSGKANTLPGNEVLSLFEDRSGRIWIGTSGGGLSYYDRVNDRIIAYRGDGPFPEIAHISPRAIAQDYDGSIWIATYGGVWKIDFETGHVSKLAIQNTDRIRDNYFVALSLYEDSKHRMWIGTNNGLYQYNRRKASFVKFTNNPADAASLSNNVIKAITEDKNGNLWIGTLGGLNELLPDGRFKVYRHRTGNNNTISSDALFALSFDKDNKLWIGTEDGVNIFDTRSALFQVLQPDPRNVFSLKSKSIRSIYIDKGGIYWVGTYGGGAAKYDENLPLFNLKQSNVFDPFGLKSPAVTSFAEYKKNLVFIGTDGSGIELFNRNTGLLTPFHIISKLHAMQSGLVILALYLDHAGMLWVGTYHDGLFRVDPRTSKYEQFTAGGTSDGLSYNDITTITQDGDGKLWIGTLGNGIDIYDLQKHTFQHLNTKTVSTEYHRAFPLNDFVTCIVKSPQGEMWVGSSGTGVAVFNPVTKTARLYNKDNSTLPDDLVEHLCFDRYGVPWLSTASGICFINEKQNKIISYTEKDGLANGLVRSIVEDNTGLLWISTDRGISTFDRYTEKFRNFTGENGVQQGSFCAKAGLITSDGYIYFGGRDGFNYFDPNILPHTAYPVKVLLTDLKVSNISVAPGNDAPIKEQIGISKEVDLKYGLNFSISYVALSFTAPKQNVFAYRLIGFDKEWNYVHRGQVANYTNIDPGSYTFQVKASSNEHWDSPVTQIRVMILPPFYRTGYAYAFYILAGTLGLLLLRRRGIQRIQKKFEIEQEKRQVRQMIAQERREAEQLHELDLLKIKFLTDLSHEFRTPISLIVAPAEKLLQSNLPGKEKDDVKMINRNARRLLNMVNQLLDFRKMEEQELKLNLETGDIIHFVKETADSFKDVAARKQVTFSVENTCARFLACFDHNKLERIIFNLLSNAFKFTTPGGNVTLLIGVKNIEEEKPCLILTFSDTGVGIPAQDLEKIFDRFYQHKDANILNQGSGIGLSITKEFVKLYGGNIRVESQLQKGSRFIVELPLLAACERSSEILPENVPEEIDEKPFEMEPDTFAAADKKTTVLLVEDNDEFRSYLADHLKQYYVIIEAANGNEGWQKTLAAHPQVVVSDINMPLMTGIELSKKLKADKRTCHIPVILLTAMTGEEEQLKGLKSGASDYLSKPFNFQILHTKINNLLHLNQSLKNTYSKQIQLTGQEVVTESGNIKLLNAILKYIEDRMSNAELSVEELSKHVCMSRGSLYYKLIELTGLTPIEYIRTVKLEKAAALLETSDLNVAQIAYMTGFGTPSYFSKMFKSKFGMVPSEYISSKRKQVK